MNIPSLHVRSYEGLTMKHSFSCQLDPVQSLVSKPVYQAFLMTFPITPVTFVLVKPGVCA